MSLSLKYLFIFTVELMRVYFNKQYHQLMIS